MFIPIIIIIITLLSLLSINALFSLKINQYINSFKVPIVKQFISQEKMIIEATDSYCRFNFSTCESNTSITNEMTLTLTDIQPYMPQYTQLNFGTRLYESIRLNKFTKEITLIHKIPNPNERLDYINHHLNKNEQIFCQNGDTIPCTDMFIGKKKPYSEKLQIMFIDDNIAVLTSKLMLPEEYPGSYTDIQNEIDKLMTEKSSLTLAISSKKLTGF